jgi:NAD(P)-dependent dehydrogenase (short-subunit alcohol dehydrogenase family)
MCGAGPGVGRAVAILAAQRGANVALLARTAPTLHQTAAAVETAGTRSLCVPADVSDPLAVQDAIERTLRQFGRIDVLVHSILPPSHLLKPVLDLDDDDLPAWRDSVNTSVFGALTVSRAVAREMTANGSGSIVFITATSALQGYPTVSAHAAGKAGIHALAQCLAAELGPRGVRVNCVAPGVINGATMRHHFEDPRQREEFAASQAALNPLRRMPTDADVAEAALFLASEAAAGITGQILPVDGGRLFH